MKPVCSSDGFQKRVFKNFSALVVIRGLGLIAPLISLPYILRVIGMELYGHVALSMIIGTFAGSIIQYGFPITAVKAVARNKASLIRLTCTYWNNYYASLLIALFVGIAHLTLTLSLPNFREMWLIHFGAIAMTIGTALFPHWFFLGIEKSFIVALSTLFVRLTHLALILIFIRDPEDFVYVNLLGAVGAWLNVLIAIWLIVFQLGVRPIPVRLQTIARVIHNTFPAFLLQWAPNMYNSASMILLGFYVSPVLLGGFNAANTLVTTVSAIGQLLANALLPVLSHSFDRHRLSAMILIVSGIFVAVSLYAFAPGFAQLLSNSGIETIQNNIRYLALSVPFLFVYLAFGHIYVALTEMRFLAGRLTVVISIVGFVCAFFLIPLFGEVGFAALMVLARASMALMAFTLYKTHVRQSKERTI